MSDITGQPVDDDITYATPEDIVDVLRSFEFDELTNPTESQVNRFIEKKTRKIEKQIPTAFRKLKIENLELEVQPKSNQKRDKITVRSGHLNRSRGSLKHRSTTDKWVTVQLPHYFIDKLTQLELKSATGSREIDLENPDESNRYDLDAREGILRIDYRYFPSTGSGTAGANRLKDARVNISYKYGKDFVEPDITEATAKLVTYDLINSDAFSELRSEDDTFIDLEVFTERIKEDADSIINHYKY